MCILEPVRLDLRQNRKNNVPPTSAQMASYFAEGNKGWSKH